MDSSQPEFDFKYSKSICRTIKSRKHLESDPKTGIFNQYDPVVYCELYKNQIKPSKGYLVKVCKVENKTLGWCLPLVETVETFGGIIGLELKYVFHNQGAWENWYKHLNEPEIQDVLLSLKSTATISYKRPSLKKFATRTSLRLVKSQNNVKEKHPKRRSPADSIPEQNTFKSNTDRAEITATVQQHTSGHKATHSQVATPKKDERSKLQDTPEQNNKKDSKCTDERKVDHPHLQNAKRQQLSGRKEPIADNLHFSGGFYDSAVTVEIDQESNVDQVSTPSVDKTLKIPDVSLFVVDKAVCGDTITKTGAEKSPIRMPHLILVDAASHSEPCDSSTSNAACDVSSTSKRTDNGVMLSLETVRQKYNNEVCIENAWFKLCTEVAMLELSFTNTEFSSFKSAYDYVYEELTRISSMEKLYPTMEVFMYENEKIQKGSILNNICSINHYEDGKLRPYLMRDQKKLGHHFRKYHDITSCYYMCIICQYKTMTKINFQSHGIQHDNISVKYTCYSVLRGKNDRLAKCMEIRAQSRNLQGAAPIFPVMSFNKKKFPHSLRHKFLISSRLNENYEFDRGGSKLSMQPFQLELCRDTYNKPVDYLPESESLDMPVFDKNQKLNRKGTKRKRIISSSEEDSDSDD